jgi:uncharacterized membrane protein YuzA (DUF378 family)
MNALIKTLLVLAIIGAINWGLVGFFQWNLVQAIFAGSGAEEANAGERIIYALVGLGGLAALLGLPRIHLTETRTRAPATRATV